MDEQKPQDPDNASAMGDILKLILILGGSIAVPLLAFKLWEWYF